MYLRERLLQFLKWKNVLFVIVGVFLIVFSVAVMVELIVVYFGDWDTVWNARATPECIVATLIGLFLVISSRLSRLLIHDAVFFSRYFEGDLSGYVTLGELSEVTGKTAARLRRRLRLLRRLYMKGFTFVKTEGEASGETVELASKTVACVCRSCGGEMEKRVYFTGECPYCGSSDLSAQVVSGEHFFCIYDDETRRVNDPAYYRGKRLEASRIGLVLTLGVTGFFLLISLCMLLDALSNLNDRDYMMKDILADNHRFTFEQVRKHLKEMIIFSVFELSALVPALVVLLTRLSIVKKAKRFALFFSRIQTPYVAVSEQAAPGSVSRHELLGIVRAIRGGYLRGCSPEKHGGPLRIGLAKQIVKDRCPGCGAPITGAVDENYVCSYCGRTIMGVIRKH